MSVEPQDSFSNKLDQVRKSTAQDNQLTRLSRYINTGFPHDKKNLLTDLHEFWNHREALSIKSRLITCGNRIIVPREMRPEMLQYIHEGHQDKERCLLLARKTVFWPKMTYDVQELIERCIQPYNRKSSDLINSRNLFSITKQKGCQGIDSFYELFAITELPNNELTSIHTRDLPPLLL